jgi:hypothetical protein
MTTVQITAIVVLLFSGILACLEIGLWLGRRAEGPSRASGPLAGALFALMGLLLAFTFSGAAARYEAKRLLIVSEANAFETAYLRIDLLPRPRQDQQRDSFRQYLDSRLAFYRKFGNSDATEAEKVRFQALQRDIWSQAIAACREGCGEPQTVFVLSSLNAMIDIATTRLVALQTHPPLLVFVLLALLPLICSLLAGYDAAIKGRSLLHMLGFAVVLTITIYVILDYEYPRAGYFISLDATDQLLVNLRQHMNHH